METKKNKKYDLERRRPVFFGIGMIISLSLALVAFEWKSEIDPIIIPEEPEEEIWYVMIDPIVTKQDQPKPPKPIKQEKQVIDQATIIKEVTEEFSEETDEPDFDLGQIDIEISDDAFKKEEKPTDAPFLIVEEMPSFPGGERALLEHIANNLKYPRGAQRMGIQGRVSVKFIIDEEGRITNIEIVRGIGAGCDEEAIRVLKTLPKFSPGKQRGQPVKVQMQLPINFKLQ